MPRGCATTAIISMVGQKGHGTARIANYTPQGCAKIAISTTTTGKRGSKREINMNKTTLWKKSLHVKTVRLAIIKENLNDP